MSATKDTLQKVSDQFEAELVAELEQMRDQSVAVVEAARKEAAEAVAKTLDESARQAESLRRQIVGSAELEARNAQLRALETAVTEVFERAQREIAESDPAEHEAALDRLIREGLDVIGNNATVYCSAKDKKVVSALSRKLSKGHVKLRVDEKGIQTIGGVTMATPDGSVRFENTFEARLERMRPTLRKDIADLLAAP